MPTISTSFRIFVTIGFLTLSTGCYTANHAQRGALVGSGLGAATGAIIGSHTGDAGAGALIGAAAGALGGGLIGDAEDAREERDSAIAQASYAQQMHAVEVTALRNSDIVTMAQSGVGDSVIIQAIRSKGGRFDTSPTALIALKQSGVSDIVLQAMQEAPAIVPAPGIVPYNPDPTVIYAPAPEPPVIIYERPYRPWRRRWHHRHYYHHGHGHHHDSGASFHFDF